MNKRASTLHCLDLTKWFMAIIVVAIHTHPLDKFQNSFYFKIYSEILGLAVPFFFIASSYLLFSKTKGSFSNDNNLDLLNKYIIKTTRLYLIWSLVYLPLAIYGYTSDSVSILKSIILYIRNLIFLGKNYFSGPLWYLLSSIYAMVFIQFLLKYKWKEWHILTLSGIIYIIAQGMSLLVRNQENLNGILFTLSRVIQLSFGDGAVLKGAFFIAIGMCIVKYNIKIPRKISLPAVAICLISSALYSNPVAQLILYFFFFQLVLSINLSDKSIYLFLRKTSTVTYLTHMLFIFIWTVPLKMDSMGLATFSWAATCTLILSLLLYYRPSPPPVSIREPILAGTFMSLPQNSKTFQIQRRFCFAGLL